MKAKLQALRKMKQKQGGFTLVEIAIALVIIGIMLAAVLQGQEMIKQAEAKQAFEMFKGVQAAHYTYLEKEGHIPGDADEDGVLDSNSAYWTDLDEAELVTGIITNDIGEDEGPKNPYGVRLYADGATKNYLCSKLPDNVITSLEKRYDDNSGSSGKFLYTTSDPSGDVTGETLPTDPDETLNWWCTKM